MNLLYYYDARNSVQYTVDYYNPLVYYYWTIENNAILSIGSSLIITLVTLILHVL